MAAAAAMTTRAAGDPKNPINVEDLPIGGNQVNPIDVENFQEPSRRGAHHAGDRNNPIPVDDDDGRDPIIRIIRRHRDIAAAADLIELEVFPSDRKGKRPLQFPLPRPSDDDPIVRIIRETTVPHRHRTDCFPDVIEIDTYHKFHRNPKLEVGESSGSRRPLAKPVPEPEPEPYYCGICMDAKPQYDCFAMEGCAHVYCNDCVSQYVAAKVQDNVTSISCPDPDCKAGFLEPEKCRPILAREVFDRWGDSLCEAVIMDQMKFYCPYKDCSALLIDDQRSDGQMVITDSECPHCFRMFCARCEVPWHAGVTCAEFELLAKDERGREDLMLRDVAKKSNWQRCPKCRFYVEKVEGCMFIKCRCGFTFCYGCATEMKVNHFCVKCQR